MQGDHNESEIICSNSLQRLSYHQASRSDPCNLQL